MSDWLEQIKKNENGLLPIIAQGYKSGENLMLAWMNREVLSEAVDTQKEVCHPRPRQKIVKEIRLDCDADIIIVKVEQIGSITSHTGRRSCFYKVYKDGQPETVEPVIKDPSQIYK